MVERVVARGCARGAVGALAGVADGHGDDVGGQARVSVPADVAPPL